MTHTFRAGLAVMLLLGFYVMSAVVVALLLLGAWELVIHHVAYVGGKLVLVAGAFVIAVGGSALRRRGRHEAALGFLLTADAHPRLWQEVRRLAALAQTRPPDEIRLVAEVNAAVTEDARMLGLIPGPRRLYLGTPLMLGLTTDQWRSVVAHELGHFSGRHTALSVISYRGAATISETIGRVNSPAVRWLLIQYAKLYFAISHSVNRRQELEADAVSAHLVGPDVAASALREVAALDMAWSRFAQTYGALGLDEGRRPAAVFEGFFLFLQARASELELLRSAPPVATTSVYDTHPPLEERIAALADQPAVEREIGEDESALALLDDLDATIARLEATMYADPGLVPTSWEELAASNADRLSRRWATVVLEAATRARSGSSLGALLPAIAAGRSGPLRDALGGPDDEALSRLVTAVVHQSLVLSSGARFCLDWSGPAQLIARDGGVLDPEPAVLAAITGADDGAALMAWLHQHKVEDLEAESLGGAPTPGAEPAPVVPRQLLAAVSPVNVRWLAFGMRVVLLTDAGIVVWRPGQARIWTAYAVRGTVGGSRWLLRKAAERPIDRWPVAKATVWLPWSSVGTVEVKDRGRGIGWWTFTDSEGRHRRYTRWFGSVMVGAPLAVMEHYLGDRLRVR